MPTPAKFLLGPLAAGGCLLLAGCQAGGGALLRQSPPFARLWSAYSRPENSTRKNAPPAQVFVDVAAIAHHHPAWRLADAISRPGSARADSVVRPRAVSFDSEMSRSRVTPANFPATAEIAGDAAAEGEPDYLRPAQKVTARDTAALDETARTRQEAAANEFLNAVTKRQTDERAARRDALMFDLGDEIEAAQRLDIGALEPVQPTPETILAMTNLRLRIQLLRLEYKSSHSESHQDDLALEIRAARRQLRSLESEWSARLRVQENARQQEMKVLLFENPQKMQTAGEEKIAQTLRGMTLRDGAARDGVAASLRQRLSSDFTTSQTPLAIALPQVAWQPPVAKPFDAVAPSTAGLAATRNISNPQPLLPSTAGPPRPGKVADAAGKLRAQALREARLWVVDLSRREGWQLAERPSGQAPDRTAETLRLLKLP